MLLKSSVGVALAFIGAAVYAQSNSVELYGVIDSGLRYDKAVNGSRNFGLASGIAGQSRFGLKGSEDIGNGYSVTFTLEGGFLTTTGAHTQGRLFGRQATIGLKGGFGELRLGRQTVFGYSWTPFIASPFGVAWSGNSVGSTFGYKSGDYGPDGRINNAVTYVTPVIEGVELGVGYSFSTEDIQHSGNSNNNRVLTAGLRYTEGPFRAALTYDQLYAKKNSHLRNSQNYQLALSYDFEIVRIFAGFNEQRKINKNPATGYIAAGNDRDRAYSLGVSVPTGKLGTAMLSYQRATLSKNHGFAAAYRYRLSKRTNVYAMGNTFQIRNHTTLTNHSKRQLGVGIQHSF